MNKIIYIGPTIDGVAARNTVYEELPEPLKAATKNVPYLSGLCIPISSLAKAMREIQSGSGTAYNLYCRALKDSAEIRKGAY